jgi:hypothetical protein
MRAAMSYKPSTQSFRAIVASALLLAACADETREDTGICASPELRAAYEQAYTWSEEGARTAQCDDTSCDRLDAAVLDSVRSGAEAACALEGARAGLAQARKKGNHGGGSHGGGNHGGGNPEDQQCKNDGRFAAQTGATAYCDLSIALGGLEAEPRLTPGPESRCQRKFEDACRQQFDRIAADFPAVIGDPAADCTPFTTGEFQEAYDNARFNACLFSIGMPGADPCANGACECDHQSQCDLDCPAGGCDQRCEHACACETSCGDDCSSSCQNASLCDLSAGKDASLSCEHAAVCELAVVSGAVSCKHASKCEVEVAEKATVSCKRAGKCIVDCPECDVECRKVGKCKVKLGKGSVRCDQVGQCRIECEGGGHPRRCGDGRYVCGQEC